MEIAELHGFTVVINEDGSVSRVTKFGDWNGLTYTALPENLKNRREAIIANGLIFNHKNGGE